MIVTRNTFIFERDGDFKCRKSIVEIKFTSNSKEIFMDHNTSNIDR